MFAAAFVVIKTGNYLIHQWWKIDFVYSYTVGILNSNDNGRPTNTYSHMDGSQNLMLSKINQTQKYVY